MRKERRTIAIKLVIVYAILLVMTALPLLCNTVTQNNIGRLLGRMLTYLLMAVAVFAFYKNKNRVFSDFGYSSGNCGKQILMGGIVLSITISIFVLLPLLFDIDKKFVLSTKQTDIISIIAQIIFFIWYCSNIRMRCLDCNSMLTEREVDKNEFKGIKLLPNIYINNF